MGKKRFDGRILILTIVLLLVIAHFTDSLDISEKAVQINNTQLGGYQLYGFSKLDKYGDGLIDPEMADYGYPLDLDGDGVFDTRIDDERSKLQELADVSITGKQVLSDRFPLSCNFRKAWESGSAPGNVFDVAVEDLDNDLLNDIVFPSYYASKATLHIYENIANNNFEEVWTSDDLLSGIYAYSRSCCRRF